MRVPSINFFQSNCTYNQYDYSINRYKAFDNTSFEQKYPVIDSYSKFKKFGIKMGAHCIYCNNIMKYDNSMLDMWKKDKLFQSPISEIVKILKPYSESLHETEKTIFNLIADTSKKYPEAQLSYAIKLLSAQSDEKIIKEQLPILKEIAKAAKELPEEYQKPILELLEKNASRMMKIPTIEEFSATDFKYKIKKLIPSIETNSEHKNIKHLTELLTIPNLKSNECDIAPEVLERIRRTLAEAYKNPNYKINEKAKKSRKLLKSLIISKIEQTAQLSNCNEIVKLCKDALKRINGIPVSGKFSNKSFRYDMETILKNYDNKEVKDKFFSIASKLPTSQDNIHAFIVKYSDASSDTIGYKLFEPSVVTVEHLKPSSLNGPDFLYNWAFACKKCNNKRQSNDMNEFFKNFNPFNAEKYWNQIVKWSNDGYISFKDTINMLKIFKRQCSSIKIESGKKLKYQPGIND